MVKEIKTILVLGLGTMGNGIAHSAIRGGFNVNAYEIEQSFIDRGMSTIEKNLGRDIKAGIIDEQSKSEIFGRIKGFTNLEEAAKGVDFVIEAVFEDIKVKIDLFSRLNKILPEDIIFASNTSTLSISMISGGSGRGDRFIGMHFFNPANVMKLCEITMGISTSKETLEQTKLLAQKMGKEVVVSKDSPGFIVNRILLPLLNEAVFALDEGVATAEDIDKGIKLGLGHPMGPLTLLDLIGLDTALHVSQAFYEEFQDSKYRPPHLLKRMVAAGKLGRKSGEGFYKY